MIAVLIFILGAVTAVFFGLRSFSVSVLAPVILLVVAVAIAKSVATGEGPGTVTFGLLAAVVAPQIGYFAAIIAAEYLHARPVGSSATLPHAVQVAVGQELRNKYELPQTQPPRMVMLLAQMKVRFLVG
jgi:hypothetical protein